MIIQVVLQLVVLVLQLVETNLIIHVGEQQRRHMGEGGQPSHHSHNGLTSSPSTLHHLDGTVRTVESAALALLERFEVVLDNRVPQTYYDVATTSRAEASQPLQSS